MTGEDRRKALVNYMEQSTEPLSGTRLAKVLGVSRQIIVQDIALLRAQNIEIDATPKGYVLHSASKCQRVFQVSHSDQDIEDELNTIVDLGGFVLDVFVEHDLYGFIKAPLQISCRRQVQKFMSDIASGKSRPLKNLSDHNLHFHTVQADSEETLHIIEQALSQKGYLV